MSTDTPRSAVTEIRSYSVRCRRRIVEPCEVWDEVTSDDHAVTSLTAAEAALRANGWKLHADGTASCPVCIAAWEEGLDLPNEDVKGDPADDPDEVPDPDVGETIPHPDAGTVLHAADDPAHGYVEAQAAALRAEVEGDDGYGEALAGR